MNSAFKFKLIQALNKKNGNKGFTLIELLVVVIIIGVLAAIALPNLLGQVAKGRQAEARTALGVVNRAQQVYRLENTTFGAVSQLPVQFTTIYYAQPSAATITGTPTANGAEAHMAPQSTYENDILEYGAAVGQTTGGTFSAVVCEQATAASTAALTPGDLTTPGSATAAAACAAASVARPVQ
ncbi:MAG: prepilin-type N-terminal cleavage/methylation domain-containing protein [Microcystis sp. M015S2]|uniref:type IV pilin protein n=2 Tax=Microcystis TaxID=1125 RepID=UPI0025904F9D|nr:MULTISPECIES: type IV pilin-like G/H family protein [unclassified Microcystis]MCA2710123.1 prepilin-type N-terminal cleavage/methylation domain-containing protein [Microcystis sp. M025S2]MCA2744822.1 prepilin-type N-terminal cleavage/methylation domain-containing protein [Microcystis sp. M015S2]MCA2760362.1 prepilin-type N-terminal cleavage/methylation domain-containing protein [Microcystis sp. M145S2]